MNNSKSLTTFYNKIIELSKNLIEKIKKRKKIITDITLIILIAFFCYSITPKTFQNDTFYTVTIGNDIIKNGIDMKDHYSWIQDLAYTYPHWLYDVFIALIYNIGNWKGVYISTCILSMILGIVIYKVNKNLCKNQSFSFAITLLAMYLLKDYVTARAQLVTFILFVLAIYCIEKFLENPKKIHYGLGIVIISLVIANIHVAVWPFLFILTLPYIAEFIICCIADFFIYQKTRIIKLKLALRRKNIDADAIRKKLEDIEKSNERRKIYRNSQEPYKITMKRNNNVKWLILVIILSALMGLCTPLKDTPYTYLYKTMIGNTTKNISEHLPLTLAENIPITSSIVIFLAVMTFTKTKIKLSDLFMIGGLTALMFFSRRQSTMFILMGTIILNRMIMQLLSIYIDENKNMKKNLKLAILVLSICFAIIFGYKFTKRKKNDVFINEKSYPVEASNWILENLDINNIKLFNEYNYGSYLLYRGIPVFIDSRADLYAPEFSNKEEDIFMDFINTSNIGKYYGNTVEQYEITHLILFKNSKISMLIDKADAEKYDKIYSDDNFVIYQVIKR